MKRIIFLTVCVLFAALAFGISGCSDGSDSGGNNTRGTISLQEIEILPQNNAFNGDTENPVCLDIYNGATELFDIRVRIENPYNYKILSLKLNGTTVESEKFGAESTNYDVYIKNVSVGTDADEYTVKITDIAYEVGGETRRLTNLKGNEVTVLIDPDFELTLDFSEANSEEDTVRYTVNYMAALPLPSDTDMNSAEKYGYVDYIFVGWYTAPEGGEKIENTKYIYYKNVTLYARYARAFNYVSDGGQITVTGLTDEGKATYFEIVIPSEIDGLPVTSVGNRAFAATGSGKTFRLPDSVETIGDYAFYNCTNLCVIMNGVKKIGYAAFMNTGKMSLGHLGTTSELPMTLEYIGDYAFSGSGFDTIFQPPGASSLNTYSLSLFIPATVNYIGDNAFSGSLFRAVYFPAGTALNTGVLPKEDDEGYDYTDFQIGEGIFRNSLSLRTVITGYTFSARGAIQSATSGGLEVVSDYMFYNCRSLASASGSSGLILSPGLKLIGAKAFSGENVSGSTFGLPELKTLSMPDSLEYIGESAFANAALQQVVFGQGSALKTLGDWCFQETAMSEITFYSLTKYGKAPFWANTSMKTVNILSTILPTFVTPVIIDGGDTLGLNVRYFVRASLLQRFRTAEGWKDVSAPILAYEYVNKDEGYVFEPVNADGALETSGQSGFAKITYMYSDAAELTIPSVVTADGMSFYTVTDIGEYVTPDSANMSPVDKIIKIRIPNTVIRIDECAFYEVSKLGNLVWTYTDDKGVIKEYSYDDVSGLKLKSVGDYAFGHTALTYFKSPSTLEYVGVEAFMYAALQTVDLSLGSNAEIGASAFSTNAITMVTIGGVGYVGGYAFANQTEGTMTVRFLNPTPPANLKAFDPFLNCTVSDVFVPSSVAVNDYNSSGFSTTLKGKYKIG